MSVYFATSGRYMKIGHSSDPVARSATITRNGTRPDDVEFCAAATLLGWIPGDAAREKQFHSTFADARVAGEWFLGIDEAVARELIWADPYGVDMQRMSALAVLLMVEHPELSRDDLAGAGIQIEATPLGEALASIDRRLSFGATRGAA